MSNVYIELPAEASPRWKSPVANAGSLPAIGNSMDDVRVDRSTSSIYIWDGSAWLLLATPGGSGNAITGLIGDVTASGPGVAVASLAATTNNTLTTLSSLSLPAAQVTGRGNLTDAGTDGIVITNGTNSVLGSGTSIAQHVADSTHNGYLSSVDWSTFNSKQPAGTYVTAISIASSNGFAGSSSGGATPTLTLSTTITGILQGNGTAISAASTTGSGAVVLATSPTLVTPALGTPSALVGTNITGTATSFTASNVTTNANLTGGVTSVGNAATVVTNANLTGPITSVGNATSVASQTGTGSTFVMQTSPTLITPNLGTPTTLVGTNITGTGSGFTAGNINATTNSTITTLSALSLPAAQLTGKGNLTDAGTDGITITGGSGAVLGTGASIAQQVSNTTQNGYLSSTDWNTFNGKVDGKANLTTVGAIPYVSASGVLNQDAANLFWDATNHRLGIGTNSPFNMLDVLGPARIGSGPASVTTLNGAITAGSPATGGALTVASTTTYPASGTVLVGSEAITYTGTTGTTFTGITRGALGTTAASAIDTSSVNYYLASVSTSATARPNLAVTGNGFVGIGVAAPGTALDVQNGSAGSTFRFWSTPTTNAQATFTLAAGSTSWTLYNKNNGPTGLWLGLSGALGVGFDSVYDVSINDSNFYDQLWVNGNTRLGATPSTPTTLNTGAFGSGTTTMTVVSTTGYPSVGTLLIENEVVQYVGKTATTFANLTRGYFGTTAAAHSTGVSVTNYLLNVVDKGGTTAVPRLSVLGTGRVGIGTVTPGAGLDVNTTGIASAIIAPRDTTGNQPTTLVNGMFRYNTTTALFEFYQNGAWVNYTTVSDARLKTNVTPVTDALGIVDQLNPVYFDWDQTDDRAASFGTRHQVGFLAQEVEVVLPEAVSQGEDTYRTLETDKILSIAVAAIKELHTTILSQDARINTLNAIITQLQSDVATINQSAGG